MAEEKLLTTKEVADILGMARPSSVSKLVMRKQLPCIKKGKLTYFNEDDVLKYMEARDGKGKKVVEPVKDVEPDIAEDGMRFTAYGKPIGKDPKESAPSTPLDKRHLFMDSNGFEKSISDELEKEYIDSDIKACGEVIKRTINNVFGLDKTVKIDGKCNIHIDIDARHITYQYVRSLTDEEFGIFIQKCVNDRLKRK